MARSARQERETEAQWPQADRAWQIRNGCSVPYAHSAKIFGDLLNLPANDDQLCILCVCLGMHV